MFANKNRKRMSTTPRNNSSNAKVTPYHHLQHLQFFKFTLPDNLTIDDEIEIDELDFSDYFDEIDEDRCNPNNEPYHPPSLYDLLNEYTQFNYRYETALSEEPYASDYVSSLVDAMTSVGERLDHLYPVIGCRIPEYILLEWEMRANVPF